MAGRKLFPTIIDGPWKPSTDLKGVYVLDQKAERAQLSPNEKAQVTRAVEKVRQKIASLKSRQP